MKLMISSFAAFAMLCTSAALAGGDGCKGAASEAKAGYGDKVVASKDGCGKDTACATAKKTGAPMMMYKVGEKMCCCPDQAKELAKGDEKAIKFVVAGKEYTDKNEALTAYGDVLEKHLNTMTMVSYVIGDECVQCPMAAKELASKNGQKIQYRVAMATFENKDDAEKAAKAAKEAAEKVTMKTIADGKEVSCETQTKDAKNVEFAVGDTKTCCKIMAKVNLAQAKIKAAAEAAQPKTAETTTETPAKG